MDNIGIEQKESAGASCHCGHCQTKPEELIQEAPATPRESSEVSGVQWRKRLRTALFLASLPLFAAGFFLSPGTGRTAAFLTAYLFAGYEIIGTALTNLRHGKVFDENFLMIVASAGAFFIGEYPEAAGVMIFFSIGELLQDRAVDKSHRSIQSLLEIKPEQAVIEKDGELVTLSPDEVPVGARLVVSPGERIALDGEVLEGESLLDTSALTGESLPREAAPGEKVFSGTVNLRGVLRIRVEKPAGESAVSRILAMVREASARKSPTEKFITRFARYYTPAVVAAAFLIALAGGFSREWIYRALIFLVVSCPCALVLSIPLAYFAGIGAASRKGILVKGGNYLDALVAARQVLFDKTGTLTTGRFRVEALEPAGGASGDDLLYYAAYAECFSGHPLAEALRERYGKELDHSLVKQYQELSGFGVKAEVAGRAVLLGNRRLLEKEGIPVPASEDGPGVRLYAAVEKAFLGMVLIRDTVKEGSRGLVAELHRDGIDEAVMLTGDSRANADWLARELELDVSHAELLPQDKLAHLERYRSKPGKTIAVGDGINDAPLLAGADVGIAMGTIGSDAAVEAADVVLMSDNPRQVLDGIRIARKTKRVVWQNILLALGIKAAVMALSTFGLAAMYQAIIADVGVAILAILNSARILGGKGGAGTSGRA